MYLIPVAREVTGPVSCGVGCNRSTTWIARASTVSLNPQEASVMAEKDHALTIRLPEDLHEQLKVRAELEERTIAGVLRMAAKLYLNGRTEATPTPA
jgi:hypothetical protein